MSQTEPIQQAVAQVREVIAECGGPNPGTTDGVGHYVNVHLNDGAYAATVNYETCAWLDYDVLDRINDRLDLDCGLPIEAEYLSEHEVGLRDLAREGERVRRHYGAAA